MRITNHLLCIILSISFACKTAEEKIQSHSLTTKGNFLEIRYQGVGDSVVFKMFQAVEQVLKENSNGDFIGSIKIPGIDSAKFSYEIAVYENSPADTFVNLDYKPNSKEHHFIWEGVKKNASYKVNQNLEGEILSKNLDSKYLKENRELTLYLPETKNQKTPIIYFTDGSTVNYYAPYVDHLISTNIIEPIILAGIHTSWHRSTEYIYDNRNDERFKNHSSYFHQEAIKAVENSLNDWNGLRYIYGVSNGAAFCLYSSVDNPEYYAQVIAFSASGGLYDLGRTLQPKSQNSTSYYMAAGRYEHGFLNDTKVFRDQLKSKDYEVEFKELICGHDYNAWRIEFLDYLVKTFPKT